MTKYHAHVQILVLGTCDPACLSLRLGWYLPAVLPSPGPALLLPANPPKADAP